MTLEALTSSQPLSQRLRQDTARQHERMHALMARADPFANREAYARFVGVQYLFQRDLEPMQGEPAMQATVPGLPARARAEAARADLQDLGVAEPEAPPPFARPGMPQALGWLYVSEGSTLGAAFLLKEVQQKLGLDATFGARHLAAHPEGRAVAWKRFITALDAADLSPAGQDAVVAGAHAAFARFELLLQRQFRGLLVA